MQSNWTLLTTTLNVSTANPYDPPVAVMQTAVAPSSGSSLKFQAPVSILIPPPDYYFFLHFAELKSLSRNESRVINILLNGESFYDNLTLDYLTINTIQTVIPNSVDRIEFSLDQASGSTLPPIINAAEVYIVSYETGGDITDVGDVDAMVNIRNFYGLVNQNWSGDPCNPKSFLWDGVSCTYATTDPSRIVSLNLQHFGLTKEISPFFGDLSVLKYLDLSMNSLTGEIPEFLGNLQALEFLNLTGNDLSGPVPKSILERVSSGKLKFSFGQNGTGEHSRKNTKMKIIVAVVASIVAFAVLAALGTFAAIKYKWCQPTDDELHTDKQFTYAELVHITNNFTRMIGRGGFGEVYYGRLKDGREVAVKKLIKSAPEGPEQFNREAQILTRIHHRNLVPLIGYCKESNSTSALIYEYMAKGSLADRLSDSTCTIGWKGRLQIGIDAAQGLDYLHNGCKPAIIHRDVKTSNILLSDELEAKIADFGLSKIYPNNGFDFVTTAVMGTPGYLDPEYYCSGKLNDRSDVYSLGVVLLELVTGKRPLMETNIVSWVTPLVERCDLGPIVDSRLNGEYNPDSVWKFLELAMSCVQPTAAGRPAMKRVLSSLKDCDSLEISDNKNWSRDYYPNDP